MIVFMVSLILLLLLTFMKILRLICLVAAAGLLYQLVSVLNRWRLYYLQDEELTRAVQGLKYLIGRGRKETELLLNGNYSRRVAAGYVIQDLSRFADGQSYLNSYLRSRMKAASERAMAEWEDRRPKQPISNLRKALKR